MSEPLPFRASDPVIGEDLIQVVVALFYRRIRGDRRLGPIFEAAIGGEWDRHLRTMCDFWSSVMRLSGRYKGNPMQAHGALPGLAPEDFDRWLTLFRETVREVCDPAVAARFTEHAERIAEALSDAVFRRPIAQDPLSFKDPLSLKAPPSLKDRDDPNPGVTDAPCR